MEAAAQSTAEELELRREQDRGEQEDEEEPVSMELQEVGESWPGFEQGNASSQAHEDRSGGSREGLGVRDSPEGRTGETRAPVSDLARERKSPPDVSIEIEF